MKRVTILEDLQRMIVVLAKKVYGECPQCSGKGFWNDPDDKWSKIYPDFRSVCKKCLGTGINDQEMSSLLGDKNE